MIHRPMWYPHGLYVVSSWPPPSERIVLTYMLICAHGYKLQHNVTYLGSCLYEYCNFFLTSVWHIVTGKCVLTQREMRMCSLKEKDSLSRHVKVNRNPDWMTTMRTRNLGLLYTILQGKVWGVQLKGLDLRSWIILVGSWRLDKFEQTLSHSSRLVLWFTEGWKRN